MATPDVPEQLARFAKQLKARKATLGPAPPPRLLVPMSPAEVARIHDDFAGTAWLDFDWNEASSLKTTRAGDRGVVYETGPEEHGLVAVLDFTGDARENPDWGWSAPCTARPLPEPVPRRRLLEHPMLAVRYSRVRRRQSVPPDEGAVLAELIGDVPFLWLPQDAERPLDEAWINADPGRVWGTERAMQAAIARDDEARRVLQLTDPFVVEERSRDALSRYDLRAAGVVVECKQTATRRDLDQIERYLGTLSEEHGGVWKGHLVAGRWVDRSLRDAVPAHPAIRLWLCGRDGERPLLQEL